MADNRVISYAVALRVNPSSSLRAPRLPRMVPGSWATGFAIPDPQHKTRAVDGRRPAGHDDVRAMAKPVLRHRLVTNFNAEAEGVTTLQIIERLSDE